MQNTSRMFIIVMLGVFLLILTFSNTLDFKSAKTEVSLSPAPENLKIVHHLYFVERNILRQEDRELYYVKESMAESILKALMKGPKNLRYDTPFTLPTELIRVSIDKYTCTVDFDESFMDQPFWNQPQPELYLWSIVNTLTELENVYDVQFLVEGSPIDRKLVNHDLSNPLPRIEEYNFKKKTYPSDIVLKFIDGINSDRFDISYELVDGDSRKKYDFDQFSRIFNDYARQFGNYTKDLHLIQDYEDYWVVIVKYSPTDRIGKPVYDSWRVVLEGSEMKINLIERLKTNESEE